MGNMHYPNRGFMLDALKYKDYLSKFLTQETIDGLLKKYDNSEDIDGDMIYDYLKDIFLYEDERELELDVNGKLITTQMFMFDEVDEGEDVEEDVLFLIFNEDDLYTRTETDVYKTLTFEPIQIEEKNWVNYS